MSKKTPYTTGGFQEPSSSSILDEPVFPIVGWAGPNGPQINDRVMEGMHQAGFTVSYSNAGETLAEVRRALDVAHAQGVRLLLQHSSYHAVQGHRLDKPARRQIEKLVAAIGDHPGLYGYAVRDEPYVEEFPAVAAVAGFLRQLDTYHLVYVNHHSPFKGGPGSRTPEASWRKILDLFHPQVLSYDHYGIVTATEAELTKLAGAPNVFPRGKVIVKSHYFECLEMMRTLSVWHQIPFWAFACSVSHAWYPEPTEGHLRFQMMNNLAYGAGGVQYFTYAHDEALVRADGSTTDTWELARRVNADLHALALQLRGLRNIGVRRTGPLWSGTRAVWPPEDHLDVDCQGDAVTIGFFEDPRQDADGPLYLMVVNGSPCDTAKIHLNVNVKDEKLEAFYPQRGKFGTHWPSDPRHQIMLLPPGDGRLFRVGKSAAEAQR